MSHTIRLSAAPTEATIFAGDAESWRRSRLEAALEHAYRRGHADGTRETAQNAAQALEQAVTRCEEAAAEAMSAATTAAVELAVRITRGLLARDIKQGAHDVEAIVRQMLVQCDNGYGGCSVHLNPADAAQLEGVAFRAGTVIESDAGVRRGDVQVVTPQGILVRDLDACLGVVRESILGDIS